MGPKIGDSTADTELLVHGKEVRVHRHILETRSYRFRAMLSGHWDPTMTEYPEETFHTYLSFLYNNKVDLTLNEELENLYDLAFAYNEVPLLRFIEEKLEEWDILEPEVFPTFPDYVRLIFANSVTVTIDNVDNLLSLANVGTGQTTDSTKLQKRCDEFLSDKWTDKFRDVSQHQCIKAICRLKQIIINKLQTSDEEFVTTYTLWVKRLHRESLKLREDFPDFEVYLEYADLCISHPPCLLDVWNLDSLGDVIKQQLPWFQRRPEDSNWSRFFVLFKLCLNYFDKHRQQFGSVWPLFCTHLANRYSIMVIFTSENIHLDEPHPVFLANGTQRFEPDRLDHVLDEWKKVFPHWKKLGPDFVQRFAILFKKWLDNLQRIDYRSDLYRLCNDTRFVPFFESLAQTKYIVESKHIIKRMFCSSNWLLFEIRDCAPVLGQFSFDNDLEEHLFDGFIFKDFKFESIEWDRVVDLIGTGDSRYVKLEKQFANYANLDSCNIEYYVNKFWARPIMMRAVGKLIAKDLNLESTCYSVLERPSLIGALLKVDGFAYLNPCPLWALFYLYDNNRKYREEILSKRNFDRYVTRRIQTNGFDFASDHPGMRRIVDLLCQNNARYVKFEAEFARNARLTVENSAVFAQKFETRPRMLEALQRFEAQRANVDNREEREDNSVSDPTCTKKQRTE